MTIRRDIELTKSRLAMDNAIDPCRIVERKLCNQTICEAGKTCWIHVSFDSPLPALALYVPEKICGRFMIGQIIYDRASFRIEVICIDEMPRFFLGWAFFKAPKL
jgi:hypothetical protein